MESIALPDTTSWNGAVALSNLGFIVAHGDDAASFLHGQMSQDMTNQPSNQARLAAYCSAKGRMLASFQSLRPAADTYWLITDLSVLPATLKRLSMFVLRAKVKLSDASSQWQLRGLLGDSAKTLISEASPWHTVVLEGAHTVALYPAVVGGVAVSRALWVAPTALTLPSLADISTDVWLWAEVMSGVTLLTQPVFEAFVPQMLNYESVGGVNFKKGCYPGQEVVARSQFRGTLKRRTALVHSPVALDAGQEVFTPTDPEQACATVVCAASRPDGQGFVALVSGTLESQETGWRLGSADGATLAIQPLPYALLADI